MIELDMNIIFTGDTDKNACMGVIKAVSRQACIFQGFPSDFQQ